MHRHKAWLVAKGYNQVEGIDFFNSFSLVAKTLTVRLFLAIATARSWPIHQVDINNAFLHGFFEEVYMTPPLSYTHAQLGKVCLLRKSLYGLKQTSRQWNIELSSRLQLFGFQQSAFDPCLFIKRSSSSFMALLVYVDDVLLTGSLPSDLHRVKAFLHEAFTIKDMGIARYFLGVELTYAVDGLHLH